MLLDSVLCGLLLFAFLVYAVTQVVYPCLLLNDALGTRTTTATRIVLLDGKGILDKVEFKSKSRRLKFLYKLHQPEPHSSSCLCLLLSLSLLF